MLGRKFSNPVVRILFAAGVVFTGLFVVVVAEHFNSLFFSNIGWGLTIFGVMLLFVAI